MQERKQKRPLSLYAQYSSMGIQMIGAILICAWIGRYLDEKAGFEQPYATLGMMLFGVAASIILLIKNIQNIQKNS